MKYRYSIKPNWRRSMAGFTLVELMISTGVFSVVLLICTTAVLVIGQDFHKAAIASLTQNTSRNIIDNITRELQYNTGTVSPTKSAPYKTVTVNAVCIGTVRYSYLLGYELVDGSFDSTKQQSPHVLWRDEAADTACSPLDVTGALAGGKELMSLHTRLSNNDGNNDGNADGLNITTAISSGGTLYNIDVAVIYGDKDVITAANNCVSSRSGGSFCGLSELHTAVFRKAN